VALCVAAVVVVWWRTRGSLVPRLFFVARGNEPGYEARLGGLCIYGRGRCAMETWGTEDDDWLGNELRGTEDNWLFSEMTDDRTTQTEGDLHVSSRANALVVSWTDVRGEGKGRSVQRPRKRLKFEMFSRYPVTIFSLYANVYKHVYGDFTKDEKKLQHTICSEAEEGNGDRAPAHYL